MVTKKTTAKKPAAPRKRVAAHPVKHDAVVTHEAAVVAAVPQGEFIRALGRRKESTARVRLFQKGSGVITVNNKPLAGYFTIEWDRQSILSPLVAVGLNDSTDITVRVEGGGVHGQATAVRHGIARALLIVNPDFRKTLRRAGYLTRDPRAKERKKPGLKRARRAPQWKKR
jgi:small subunit ribosomal protein S9